MATNPRRARRASQRVSNLRPGVASRRQIASTIAALAALVLLLSSCRSDDAEEPRLFTALRPVDTGIMFSNDLEDRPDFNILDYLYFYDGGGVALGDVNNDGLVDVFFTGNQVSDRLYMNHGGMSFEDVTEAAGVGSAEGTWSTGVTMADVNGDGWLDVYVCRVSYLSITGRNQLYINNQDGTFTERAAEYGLDFEGLSTQAAFFDYDRDGDLDVYLLNHAVHTRDSFVEAWRRIIDAPHVGDKLYRNDDGRFTDVTSNAGIYSSTLGYGLGLAVSDVNGDGWPDVYVGNDFHENDYLYLNNGDGTFSERLQHVIGHTSQSSMGNDVADFNNDGRVDIVSLDMLPPDVSTYRRSGGPDPDDLAAIKRSFGYAPQYARNTLQLHRGLAPDGMPIFSEIGLLAGIHATDWSWAGLFVDLDNDGWKDLYVTNGMLRRPNDLDYVDYVSQPEVQRLLSSGSKEEQLAVIERMPSVPLPNYAFANAGDLTFTDRAGEWGLAAPGFSNGAAYADPDNDGDLDLIVNNINAPASVFRNNSESLHDRSHLAIDLIGERGNTSGIGANVTLYIGVRQLYQEQMPTRGFQSSVSHTLHFGVDTVVVADSLVVVWPDGRLQRLRDVELNRRLTLRQREALESARFPAPAYRRPPHAGFLRDETEPLGPKFVHRENEFNDFEQQPLLPHRLSTQGPALAVADVNGDGLDDLYLGGAHGQAGALFVQRSDGTLARSGTAVFDADAAMEDVDAAFFDVDGDGHLDLYVVSGGGQHAEGDPVMADRLYLNDGRGTFRRAADALPDIRSDGCCVSAADFDGDGDLDLFVGSRSVPGSYGVAPRGYLLENDGAGQFADVTAERAPGLLEAGMVTAALWADLDGDGMDDLVLAGEWMPISFFRNDGERLADATGSVGLSGSGGWWTSLLAADADDDGDVDLIAGNVGRNTILRASPSEPLELLVADFDGDGRSDPLVVEHREGGRFTWARRDELIAQMPSVAEDLPTYAAYAEAELADLFDATLLDGAEKKEIHVFASSFFENLGSSGFRRVDLPLEAQLAPVMDAAWVDADGDGVPDLITVGNFFGADTKQGRYDASVGAVLLGDGSGGFTGAAPQDSGLIVRGEARAARVLRIAGGRRGLVVARNDNVPMLFVFADSTSQRE